MGWFVLANIDMFIICVRFELTNVDTIRTLTRHGHDTNTTHQHELTPLIIYVIFEQKTLGVFNHVRRLQPLQFTKEIYFKVAN